MKRDLLRIYCVSSVSELGVWDGSALWGAGVHLEGLGIWNLLRVMELGLRVLELGPGFPGSSVI